MDVVRVLAAVLLLGNVNFVDNGSGEVVTKGETELASVARLLGITFPSLFRGITTRTHSETSRGNTQLIKTTCDANTVSSTINYYSHVSCRMQYFASSLALYFNSKE